ncbi:MAG: hypothetical protein FWG09_00910 [Synergistaceae bacterium]|nr:hypothetical protein [Synergistaceae bacterium]
MSGASMRECNLCRRLFSSSGGRVCQDCFKYLEEIYPTVRSFIRDSKNPRALDVAEIADALEIPIKYVQGLVNNGYLNRDLPHIKSDESYENEGRDRLTKELQQATTDLKANATRKHATTYGQERYSTGKK